MDISGLNFTSLSFIEILKLLVEILGFLAGNENGDFQRRNITNFSQNTALNESVVKFSNDLYDRTVNFLRNNFKEEALTQISEKINWNMQEPLKENPPKQTQSRGHSFR